MVEKIVVIVHYLIFQYFHALWSSFVFCFLILRMTELNPCNVLQTSIFFFFTLVTHDSILKMTFIILV